jgi:hypothetical protein
MTRIFIEDQELDITKDFSQQITYAVDDLTNTDSKSTSFSKTIVLPGTANNNRLFGNIFEFSNSNFELNSGQNIFYNFNASKSAKARLEINGLQVMKGVLRLLEIIRDGDYIEYEVALFGELGGFFSSLGAKRIEQLDFSDYNHTYDVSAITSSWDNANDGEGYYYPLIDYGNVSPLNDAQFAKKSFYWTAFRPALFVREYISKIIETAGYTFSSTFMNTDFFKRLIIPNNQQRLSTLQSRIFSGSPRFGPKMTQVNVAYDIQLYNTINGLFTTSNFITFTYNSGTNFSGTINMNLAGLIQNTVFIDTPSGPVEYVSTVFAEFALLKNGSTYIYANQVGSQRPTIIGFQNAMEANFNVSATFGSAANPVTFTNGDTFKLVIVMFRYELFESEPAVNIQSGTLSIEGSPLYTPATYGQTLAITDTIPKGILQKDFFSSILKMFNLMVTEDKDIEKHLIIEPYIDFYNTDRTTYLDWSDKVDRSKPIKIKPMSEVNARFYQFKYKQDNDYWNEKYRKKNVEGYGDRVFDNALEFTKDTDTTEVIFSATPLVGYSGTGHDKVFPAIYKYNNSAEEMIEHNIRILSARKITGVTTWRIRTNILDATLATVTSYGYAGHFDHPITMNYDLNFGATKELFYSVNTSSIYASLSTNLFNVFYSPYFAEITDKDSRLVTCKMRLNEKDIYNLDFGRFVWVDGVLYRLIKIVDYSEADVCEVQLLRAINTTY